MKGADKKYILYMHTFPNGKVYIGITCKKPNDRFGADGNGYCHQPYIWNAIQKYGWDNIQHDVLFDGLSQIEACNLEKEYIEKFRSNLSEFGYNQTSGGDVGYVLSSESIAVLSAKTKAQMARRTPEEWERQALHNKEVYKRRSPEEKQSIIDKRNQTWRNNHTPEERAEQYKRAVETRKATMDARGGLTEEQKNVLRERARLYWEKYHLEHPKKQKKARYYSPKVKVKLSHEEHIKRLTEGLRKKWQDPEFREKMKLISSQNGRATLGSHYPNRKPMSEETKRKKSETMKGKHWVLTEETKIKMRKPKSEETRRRMSEAKKRMYSNMTPEQRIACRAGKNNIVTTN